MTFVADKVTLGQVSLTVGYFDISILIHASTTQAL